MSRTATCFFTGRLAKDPELIVRQRADGTSFSILKLNIITNSPRKVNGEWKELRESVFPTKISTEGLSKDQLRKIAEVVKNTRAMSSWFGQKGE